MHITYHVTIMRMTVYTSHIIHYQCTLQSYESPNETPPIFLLYGIIILHRVVNEQRYNKMTYNNLALVFGPTLMRPKPDQIA